MYNYPFKRGVVFEFKNKYGTSFRIKHFLRTIDDPLKYRISLIRFRQAIALELLSSRSLDEMNMTELITAIVNTNKIKSGDYKMLYKDFSYSHLQMIRNILQDSYIEFQKSRIELNELSI